MTTINKDDLQTHTLPTMARIRWQCRRGMLELDMLLLPFCDSVYETLNNDQKKAFIELLSFPDQTLYGFFIGREKPDSIALQKIVACVLNER